MCASATELLTQFQTFHLCEPTDGRGVAQMSLREQFQDNGVAWVSLSGKTWPPGLFPLVRCANRKELSSFLRWFVDFAEFEVVPEWHETLSQACT